MHPILFHLGHLAIPTQGVLAASGLLAGLQLSVFLAVRLALDPDRIWHLGLTTLLTFFLGERLLVIAFNLPDFLAHPYWMLGLTTVRDPRYALGGVALAICAGAGYIFAWRLPPRRVADALAPGIGLALACMSLGALAAGAHYGRPTQPGWGIVYSSRVAASLSGTPLGVPLIPVALYAAILYLLAAAASFARTRHGEIEGAAAALLLLPAGLGAVLLDQLRYRTPGELLLLAAYTPAQLSGIAAVVLAGLLLLRTPSPRT